MLSIVAGYDPQTALIDAAAKAGVKYILPVEYGSDTGHPKVAALPLFQPKVAIREHIEDLAKTHKGLSWIGIVTNPWLGYVSPSTTATYPAPDAVRLTGTATVSPPRSDHADLRPL